MKLVRCAYGHFYNGEGSTTCPYCARSALTSGKDIVRANPGSRNKVEKESWVDALGQSAPTKQIVIPPQETRPAAKPEPATEPAPAPKTAAPRPEPKPAPKPEPVIEQKPEPAPEPEEVRTIVVNPEDDPKTKPLYQMDVDPVVGWLVCVRGAYKGEAFTIFPGRNTIGRALGMRIALREEQSVSRDTHAALTFDPDSCCFFLTPGSGTALSYVNGTVLLNPQQLNAYDRVRFGKAEFVFIPLCGEKFDWAEFED